MTDLEQNLPLVLSRKPIFNPAKSSNQRIDRPQSVLLLSVSTDKSESEDSETVERIQVKRIRYLNPMKFYVTEDGHTFPTTSQESLGPIHLINLSNKVQQITIDKGSGNMTYSLVPAFDSSDVLPWRYLVEKLKYGGYADFHDLMISFEKLMKVREEWCETVISDHAQVANSGLEDYVLSDSIPQLAEVRDVKGLGLPSFPVSKYIINKPMQKLLGISGDSDAVTSLHLGVKSLKFLTQTDSIKFLQRYFENYAEHIRSRFKDASAGNEILKVTRCTADGTPLDMNVTCKMMRQGTSHVWVYSYKILDKKGNQYFFGNDSKKPGEPLFKPAVYMEEELETINKAKQNALNFLKKYNYQSKFLYVEPPKDRVCRIKELNQDSHEPTA